MRAAARLGTACLLLAALVASATVAVDRNDGMVDGFLADDVLLADRLDGAPLCVTHGAPLRLVAPAHYACKSVRHLNAIEFWRDARNYRFPGPKLIFNPPRARVALEERGHTLPPMFFRRVWPKMVPLIRWLYRMGLRRYEARQR